MRLILTLCVILGAQGNQGIFRRLAHDEQALSQDIMRLKSMIHQHRFPGGEEACDIGAGKCTGPLKLFYATTTSLYSTNDNDFETAAHGRATREIQVGVVDTGIYASTDAYLSPHVVDGRDFTAAFSAKSEVPTDGNWLGRVIADKKPPTLEPHGTRVAGQVAWGTPLIKLVDVFTQKVNSGDKDTEAQMVHAISWAISRGATVITASITIAWEHALLQALVSNNPNVVFIGTTGNARRDFDTTHAAKTKPNLLLIGGCLKDGGFHDGRGFGANTVDLFVPSDNIPVYDPADASHDLTTAKKTLQDADITEAKAQATAATEIKKQDSLAAWQAKIKMPIFANLKRPNVVAVPWQNFAKRFALLPEVIVADAVAALRSDDGVSFGIPVVANVVAKVRILCPAMTATQVAQLMRNSSTLDVKGTLAGKARSAMLNPGKAYTDAVARCA